MPTKRIVILTGAGISAESGVSTFRDKGGIWSQYDVNDVATPEGFARNPKLVHEFYNMRRRFHKDVKPNEAHIALAKLEERLGKDVFLITQNVDALHRQAGSKNLLHMHGEITKIRCQNCQTIGLWTEDLSTEIECGQCKTPGGLRPHVVWFGEMPLEMERIYSALAQCDLFLSIGTSGTVYPAAGFVAEANAQGAHTVELNLDPSQGESMFAEKIYGPATRIVPAYVEDLIREELGS